MSSHLFRLLFLFFIFQANSQFAEAARSVIVAPLSWANAFNQQGFTPGQYFQRLIQLTLKNVGDLPQQVRVTAQFRNGRFDTAAGNYVGQMRMTALDPSTNTFTANVLTNGEGNSLLPTSGWTPIEEAGSAGDSVKFVWRVAYPGPLSSGSVNAMGSVTFKVEVSEDRGVLTGDTTVVPNFGCPAPCVNRLTVDHSTTQCVSDVIHMQLSGGRTF